MKTALVCGADGFIAGHLVHRLVAEGYHVRAVGRKPRSSVPGMELLEYYSTDLRDASNCMSAVEIHNHPVDEVYQLAADMGGMGYILDHECEVMRNNALINLNMIHAAALGGVGKYFFSSSACVYPDQDMADPELGEAQAYPARPSNEYGWEKLFSERVLSAYSRHYPMAVRIGRFQNTYGPGSAWHGSRAKAVASLCRKVAQQPDGGTIEVWGDGSAMRAYTYITDILDGVRLIMEARYVGDPESPGSVMSQPFNIGRREYVSVDQLARMIIEISRKDLSVVHVGGPVGVQARGFRTDRIEALGWQSKVSLKEGLTITYQWVEDRLKEVNL